MAAETDQSYEKIQALIKEKPELSSTVSAKLASLLEELELSKDSTGKNYGFDKLHHGFRKFRKGFYEQNPELFGKLKTGQWPKFMVIACADSRVDPSVVLGLRPGDAFIVRNIANMVPPFEKEGYPSMGASLEYAVLHLKVDHILIIGHRACGGVKALVTMTPEDGKYSTTFIERWVEIGKPARKEVTAQMPQAETPEVCTTCEKETVKTSLNNLLTYPFVVDAVKDKKVSLHGGYYDLVEGKFETWDFDLPAPKV
ncbi:unnamed protein product [Calypogeia fissa]